MVKSNNYTIYGIHRNVERNIWAAYQLFVLLSSLIGDTLILYASFQKGAFKLNKFIQTVIQHIAVSDLLFAIFGVLQTTASLLANSMALGDAMCYARVYVGFICYSMGLWLIAVLTTSKFFLLKYPIRCGNWTKKMAHGVCTLTLIPASITPIAFFMVQKDDVQFDYRSYSCDYCYNASIWSDKKLIPTSLSIIRLTMPVMVVFIATIPTLKYLADARKSARRVQGSVPWQGAATVALTAAVYCLSTLPNFVYHIGESFVEADATSSFHFQFYQLSESMLMINIMANFYIYTLTIKSFRKFILSKILFVLPLSLKTSRSMTSTGNNNKNMKLLKPTFESNALNLRSK